MPLFFFHLYDDAVALDEEGIELPDRGAAERTAVASARALICEQVRTGSVTLHHRIEVVDEAGSPVACVTFGDAVKIEL
jgi:hypothetical protein